MGKTQRREMMAMEGTIRNLNYVPHGYHEPKRTNVVKEKVKEVIDGILIQERLEAAQKKRDARNAKRLKSMRK